MVRAEAAMNVPSSWDPSNSETDDTLDYLPALFSQYPQLLGRLPWVSLRGALEPSMPVRLLRSQHLFDGNAVYVKQEELDFHLLPENKARKLEFIAGDAIDRGQKKLVTFGYTGSSHCLATVKAASLLNMKAEVFLLRSHLNRRAIEMIAAMKGLKGKVRLRSSWSGMMIAGAWAWLKSKIFRTTLIPPGGSNGLGALAYMSAFLELSRQVSVGGIPKPDYLFVPVGSGSTIVGLEMGRRFVEWNDLQIIGIQTSDDKGVEPEWLSKMANEAISRLSSSGLPWNPGSFKGTEFNILKHYVFGGHGESNPELDRWMARFVELEGFDVDRTYMAKTVFGMSDYLAQNKIRGKTVLLWNTTSPFRQGDIPRDFDFRKIPFRLKRWVRQEQKKGNLTDLPRL